MRANSKIIFILFILAGSQLVYGGNPTAYLTYASFTTPQGKNYFETYLSMEGSSLKFVKTGNKYAAKAHVIIAFKQGDSIVASSNFNVLSPEVNDTLDKPDFIDVHRFWLAKGNYTMIFTMDDPNDALNKPVTARQTVHTGYSPDTVVVSDAEFLSSYTPSAQPGPYNKCGVDMIPYVFSDYPESVGKISFYCEIYNTVKIAPREKITIQYSIEDEQKLSLSLTHHFTSSVQRDADTVIPFLAQVPISNLPGGRYSLRVSVLDINHHVLAKREFNFSRENPAVKSPQIPAGFAIYMQNKDTLEESIRCLAPISDKSEQSYVMGDSLNWVSTDELKRFFYYFWRSHDSVNPLEAWQKYLDNVMKVNNSFGMRNLKGYRTDRGRVYLQYGPPSQRIVETNNPITYPHEIWEYYRMPNGQTDAKFVFYSTTVETNNYVLLHSTAIGEVKNPSWQIELYSRLGTPSDIDIQTISDELGEDVNEQYSNPH